MKLSYSLILKFCSKQTVVGHSSIQFRNVVNFSRDYIASAIVVETRSLEPLWVKSCVLLLFSNSLLYIKEYVSVVLVVEYMLLVTRRAT